MIKYSQDVTFYSALLCLLTSLCISLWKLGLYLLLYFISLVSTLFAGVCNTLYQRETQKRLSQLVNRFDYQEQGMEEKKERTSAYKMAPQRSSTTAHLPPSSSVSETVAFPVSRSTWLDNAQRTVTVTVTETLTQDITLFPSSTPSRPHLLPSQETTLRATPRVPKTMQKSFIWPEAQLLIRGDGRGDTVIDIRHDIHTTDEARIAQTNHGEGNTEMIEKAYAAEHVGTTLLRRRASAQRASHSQSKSPTPPLSHPGPYAKRTTPSTLYTVRTTTAKPSAAIAKSPPTSAQSTNLTPHASHLRPNHPHYRSTMGGTFEIGPLPANLQLVLYVGIALGALWVITVWLVNFPPHTWRIIRTTRTKSLNTTTSNSKKKDEINKDSKTVAKKAKETCWRRFYRSTQRKQKTKPVHKPLDIHSATRTFTYEPASTTSPSKAAETPSTATTTATPNAALLRKRYAPEDFPVQNQDQDHTRELDELSRDLDELHGVSIPHAPTLPPWQRDAMHLGQTSPPVCGVNGGALTALQKSDIRVTTAVSAPSTYISPLSPDNPFLPQVPVASRPSEDYRAAHHAFFETSSPSLRPQSPARSFSVMPSPSDYEDIDAMEAQTERYGHVRSKSDICLSPNGQGGQRKKRWSGVNVLQAVDGAVGWGVDKMVKWTKTNGDEDLLLPLAGGQGDGDRAEQ